MSEEDELSKHPYRLTGKDELIIFPKGTQIYPVHDYYAIIKRLAETDSTRYNDGAPAWDCPFCNGYQTDSSRLHDEPFPHQPTCIVVKAHEIVKVRNE